jgi:hypothetical protein
VSDEAARHWRERMESAAALQSKVEMGDLK